MIRGVSLGEKKEYLVEKKNSNIIDIFYKEFKNRLDKLLTLQDTVVNVVGFDPSKMDLAHRNGILIRFYRTVFSRMLFIKILLSWKMLPFDPIQTIFDRTKEERNHYLELSCLFFDVFNKITKSALIIPECKKLPYLNGGLFRKIDIENEFPDLQITSGAIKDIWDLYKRFNFISVIKEAKGKLIKDAELQDENTVDPEILGYIFERTIGNDRNASGSFYTPRIVTQHIVKNSILPSIYDKINDRIKTINEERDAKKEPRLLDIKITDFDFKFLTPAVRTRLYSEIINILNEFAIIDPACGSGAFLEMAGNTMVELYQKVYSSMGLDGDLPYKYHGEKSKDDPRPYIDLYSLRKHIVQNNLYGVDINPSAVEICELRIWLWMINPSKDLDVLGDVQLEPLPNMDFNIRCGDALLGCCSLDEIDETDEIVRDHETMKGGILEGNVATLIEEKNELIARHYQTNDVASYNRILAINKELSDNLNLTLLNQVIASEISIEQSSKTSETPLSSILSSAAITNPSYIKISFSSCELKQDAWDEWRKEKGKKRLSGGRITARNGQVSSLSVSNELLSKKGLDNVITFAKDVLQGDIEEITWRSPYQKAHIQQARPFHWILEFPRIMSAGGFDLIISNPPYVFYSNEFTTIEDIIRPIYAKFYLEEDRISDGSIQTGKMNIFSLFIMRSTKLVRENSRVVNVLGNTILRATTNTEIRKYILENFNIEQIVDLGSDMFKGVTVSTVILFLQKSKIDPENQTRIYSLQKVSEEDAQEVFQIVFLHEVKQKIFVEERFNLISTFSSETDLKLHKTCEASSVFLRDLVDEIESGLVSTDEQITHDPTRANAKKLLRGTHIDRYRINFDGEYVLFIKSGPGKLHRTRTVNIFEADKIITQRITGGKRPLIATRDVSDFYTHYSTNSIIFKEDCAFPKNYVLAILNSRLMNWYYFKYTNGSNITVNIVKSYLEWIPIKNKPEWFGLIDRIVDLVSFVNQFNSNQWCPVLTHEKDVMSELLELLLYDLYLGEENLLKNCPMPEAFDWVDWQKKFMAFFIDGTNPPDSKPIIDLLEKYVEALDKDESLKALQRELLLNERVKYINKIFSKGECIFPDGSPHK